MTSLRVLVSVPSADTRTLSGHLDGEPIPAAGHAQQRTPLPLELHPADEPRAGHSLDHDRVGERTRVAGQHHGVAGGEGRAFQAIPGLQSSPEPIVSEGSAQGIRVGDLDHARGAGKGPPTTAVPGGATTGGGSTGGGSIGVGSGVGSGPGRLGRIWRADCRLQLGEQRPGMLHLVREVVEYRLKGAICSARLIVPPAVSAASGSPHR